MSTSDLITAADMNAQCRCLNLQRAARTLARHYDAALKPVGLTSGQFAILAALNRPEPATLGGLATALGLERTTLTRNLALIEARGMIAVGGDARDQRARAITLTSHGLETLSDAMPHWRDAQAISLAALDGVAWPDLRDALSLLRAI